MAGDMEEWTLPPQRATSGWRHMKAKIIVMPKRTVLDPQGKTVKHALESMDFKGIKDVRVGKFMEIELEGGNKAELQKKIDEACHKLLSNPVIEEYSFKIE
jgi:phosphoribosylformylglycinamidine synthase subunit PurS